MELAGELFPGLTKPYADMPIDEFLSLPEATLRELLPALERLPESRRPREIPSGVDCEAICPDPADVVLAQHEAERILDLIKRLPKRQQEVLCMCGLCGMLQEEAAHKLGIDQSVVSRHLSWAKKNLNGLQDKNCIKQPHSRLHIWEELSPAIRETYEVAAHESPYGEGGFLFTPVIYYPPKRGWLTPFMLAKDKRAYLRECFGDDKTVIPAGFNGSRRMRKGA